MSSQKSFAALIERFKNGNTLVQAWADYAPGNAKITKAGLTAFILAVETANTAVGTTETDLGTARTNRNPLVFEIEDTNPLCFETCVRAIESYLGSDDDKTEFIVAAKSVGKILSKIRPRYKKKKPEDPRGMGNSPMEKNFASAVGQGKSIILIITNLGADYAPADANLSVASMTTLVGNIETGNGAVQTAKDNYGTANRARLKLYTGLDGLKKRATTILRYLGSFPGLKQSDHYKEFNQAIKGT